MTRNMTIGDVKSLCEKLAKPHGFTVRDIELKDRPEQYWGVESAKEPGVTVVGPDCLIAIWWDDGFWVYSLVYSEHTHSVPRGHADAEKVVVCSGARRRCIVDT